jgi:hypothetical protein
MVKSAVKVFIYWSLFAALSYNVFICHIFLYTSLIVDVLKFKFMVNKI